MDNPNCNTKRSKGQHLTYEERVEIEIRLKDGWSLYRIHKHIGCVYNTIKNEYEEVKFYSLMVKSSVTKHQSVRKHIWKIVKTAKRIIVVLK